MRVFGSLMWSLGKVLETPEACKVYVGSFGDRPLRQNNDLFNDLFQVPKTDPHRDLYFHGPLRTACISTVLL